MSRVSFVAALVGCSGSASVVASSRDALSQATSSATVPLVVADSSVASPVDVVDPSGPVVGSDTSLTRAPAPVESVDPTATVAPSSDSGSVGAPAPGSVTPSSATSTPASPAQASTVPPVPTAPAAPTVGVSAAPIPTVVSPSQVRVITGTANITPLIRQRAPLLLATTAAPAPTDVTAAVTTEGSGIAVAASGSAVRLTFQMYSWRTGELYDGTPPGQPLTVTVGSRGVPAALDAVLVGVSAGTEMIVTYPVGMADLPGFVPDDDAYYVIVLIEDITG